MISALTGTLSVTGNSSVPPSVTGAASATETSRDASPGVASSLRTVTAAVDGSPRTWSAPACSVRVTAASASSASSSSVAMRRVAVASPAAKVTPVGGTPASTAPESVTATGTSSDRDSSPSVRVRVNTASSPSVTVAAPAATVTTGRSSSRTLTVVRSDVRTSYSAPGRNARVSVASASSTASSTVSRRSVAVVSPAPKVTLIGGAPASTAPESVIANDTSSASEWSPPVRVNVNAARSPSVTVPATLLTFTTGRSPSRIRPVAVSRPSRAGDQLVILTVTVSGLSSMPSGSATKRMIRSVTPRSKNRLRVCALTCSSATLPQSPAPNEGEAVVTTSIVLLNGLLSVTGNANTPPSTTSPASAMETVGASSSSRTVTVAVGGAPRP